LILIEWAELLLVAITLFWIASWGVWLMRRGSRHLRAYRGNIG